MLLGDAEVKAFINKPSWRHEMSKDLDEILSHFSLKESREIENILSVANIVASSLDNLATVNPEMVPDFQIMNVLADLFSDVHKMVP